MSCPPGDMRPRSFRNLLIALLLLLTSSTAHANSLTLAWDAASDTTTAGYIVWYGTASGVYTSRLDVGLVTQRQVAGLADGTRYFFAVQAYSPQGEVSELSSEVSGTTSGVAPSAGGIGSTGGSSTGGGAPAAQSPAPSAPASSAPASGGGSVVATLRDGRFIDIAWLAISGAAAYRVEVGNAPGHTNFSATTPHTTIAFDTASMPTASYFVRVRAIAGGVVGAASNEDVVNGSLVPRLDVSTFAAGVHCADPPGAPRQFAAGANGTAVHLSWLPGNGSSATGYVLQVGSAPGLQNLMVVPLPAGQGGLSATAAAGFYALRLVATNDCGPSTWGAEALLTVGTPAASSHVAAPAAPVGLTQQVSGTLVSLSWTAPSIGGPVTRYLIEATTSAGPVAVDTGNPSTTFSHPNTPSGQYVVTVRAGNAAGFGPPSAPVTVVVP